MQHITRKKASRYRHAYRPVHAKSHGILLGTLEVLPNLPPHLAQGLFSKPGATYAALMRFSTNPNDILTDKVSSPRGLAIKFIGVEGEKTPNHSGALTQDLVHRGSSQLRQGKTIYASPQKLRCRIERQ